MRDVAVFLDQINFFRLQDPGPHVHVRHFPQKAFSLAPGIQLVAQGDGSVLAHLVTLPHDKAREEIPVQPEVDQASGGVPGHADVLPLGLRPLQRRDDLAHPTYEKVIGAGVGLHNLEILALLLGRVREEGIGAELEGGLSQADGEVGQGLRKGDIQKYGGLLVTGREDKDFLLDICKGTKDICVNRTPAYGGQVKETG